ncbi:intelectin-1a-like [Petromyzon marinus]|uniref:Intelectin-1a-like n=1 Tax=Petromyzon marinus TaxID=7757 RepID=A0AAJ7UA63_PETMA|nr:intelectin-1a-like [Petromyzon marinus]
MGTLRASLLFLTISAALVSAADGGKWARADNGSLASSSVAVEIIPTNGVTPLKKRTKYPNFFSTSDDGGITINKKTCLRPHDWTTCAKNLVYACCKKYPRSCLEIKQTTQSTKDGIYSLQTKEGKLYQAFCDMHTKGGGWTLVASVHENNIAAKCAIGDRWSSQQGSNASPTFVDGDGNWANVNVFNKIHSATDTDYKNEGYYDLDADDIAIWHVPNGTPLLQWKQSAILRYHTEVSFLEPLGGNLYSLYKNFYPLKFASGVCQINNGPFYPIVYDFGNNNVVNSLICPNCIGETRPGFVQFRVFNTERAPFAICSGVMALKCNTEHYCIGGAGYVPQQSPRQCGDFSAFDWDGYGTQISWSASKQLLEASVLIYYR